MSCASTNSAERLAARAGGSGRVQPGPWTGCWSLGSCPSATLTTLGPQSHRSSSHDPRGFPSHRHNLQRLLAHKTVNKLAVATPFPPHL